MYAFEKRLKHFEMRGVIVNKVKCKQRLGIWKYIRKELISIDSKNKGEYNMGSLWKVQGSKSDLFY